MMDAYSSIVVSVAEKLSPAVASVRTYLQMLGGRRASGSGAAVAMSPDGFLLTSAHVIAESSAGSVAFASGEETDFEVVGADALSDLAVIKATGLNLTPAVLGDADRLKVGQLVIAVGNPFGFAGSVTAGVVSALGRSIGTRSGSHFRTVENVIQTDAAVHPGNSGGALADSAGELVGIVTALAGAFVGQGLGLAVPVNSVTLGIVSSLMRNGTVRRAFVGVTGGPRPLPPRAAAKLNKTRGFEIVEVLTGSPADLAGIRPGDILVEVGGRPVEDGRDLQQMMNEGLIGKKVGAIVWRGGEVQSRQLEPVELL